MVHRIILAAACALLVLPAWADEPKPLAGASAGTKVQGKIVRTEGDNQVIVRTQDNKELTLFANPQARFMIDNKPAHFNDLRAGADITADYMVQDGRNMIGSLWVGAAAPGASAGVAAQAQSPLLNGKIVRVMGNNQVVIQTADGREMSLYFAPQPGMPGGLQANGALQGTGTLQTDLNLQPGINGQLGTTIAAPGYIDAGVPLLYDLPPWRRPVLRIGAAIFGRARY